MAASVCSGEVDAGSPSRTCANQHLERREEAHQIERE